jgi:enoyl-CoA hydratase/carnithine racemase
METELPTATVRVEGGVACATFENPPINLVGPPVTADLARVLDMAEADPGIRVLVVASADPDFFFAHADIVALGSATPAADDPHRRPPLTTTLARLAASPVVSIAKIRGRARAAGSEIALACDMRFAATENTILAQSEVGVGLLPGAGGTQRLSRLLGRGRALEAILGADDYDALTAERYGWINRAVPDANLDRYVDGLATRIATFPPAAVTRAKKLVDRVTLPPPEDLKDESRAFTELLQTEEVAARVKQLLARGAQTRSPLEYALGAELPSLTDPTRP